MKIEMDISSNDVNALKDAIKKSVKAEFKVSIRELKAKNFALRGAVAARDSQLSALRKQLSVLQNKENEFDNLLAMKKKLYRCEKV